MDALSELIGCCDASFAYEGHIAVSGLNFSVKNGDYLCIVGENGSGKSTLLRGLLRLIRPASGSIHTDDDLKANEIGYLPQQTAPNKDFPASVYEVVLTGRLGQRGVRPFYSRADRTAAEENMARLGISNIKNNCYGELSGGQQQRVLLVRALCSAHKLLLLDEPASGLDPIVVQELYKQISELNRYLSLTIIMVSHDIHSAVKYADHILHLDKKQIFFGTTDDYKRSDIGARFLN